ncbi:MAG: hypothetical protein NWE99_05770 [Candidatus Bathyarchaeota archaeon]|nr:hypothetical protein [Candidatus Bathyarchaeota archaeon]
MTAPNDYRLAKLRRSMRAIAIPITFLLLFVSMLGVISITYYFAVEKVNTRSTTLKIATAKQDMLSLDDALMQVIGQPGAARTFEFSDSGGQVNIQPSANTLAISIGDGGDIAATVCNETIGQVSYVLPYSESPDTGLFLKGDSRTIVSQSGSVMTQLYIVHGAEHPEILLRYRPTVSYATAGTENGKTVNNIRVYIINLNASDAIALYGKVPLKISCVATQISTTTYDLSYEPESLTLTANLDGASGQVTIPVSSTSNGAIVNVETVLCNVRIQRWLR